MSRSTRAPSSAAVRLGGSIAVGGAVGLLVLRAGEPALAGLTGFALTHLTFVVWGWAALWPMDAETTRSNSRRERLRRTIDELLVVVIAVGALVGIVLLMLLADSAEGNLAALIALAGVFMAWASLHLMYSSHYADLYYEHGEGGGIDFNMRQPPSFSDFLYFSYTLGMTYAVSDTNVSSPAIRNVVVRQTLLSYVFGMVVMASTINLVAGITIS